MKLQDLLVNLPLGIKEDTLNKILINATLQHEKRDVFVFEHLRHWVLGLYTGIEVIP